MPRTEHGERRSVNCRTRHTHRLSPWSPRPSRRTSRARHGGAAPRHHAGRAAAQPHGAQDGARSRLLRRLHGPRHPVDPPRRIGRRAAAGATSRRPVPRRSKSASATTRFDNTHPLRGDGDGGSAHHARQPAADRRRGADPPRAVARDRPRLQAGGRSAHTRAHQRRREDPGRRSGARLLARRASGPRRAADRLHDRYAAPGKSGCAGCRRRSAKIR